MSFPKQHTKPCHDCPWRRKAVRGWLGPMKADEWLEVAHNDVEVQCHTKHGCQCAGLAIYRRNVSKLPRTPDLLVLPKNTKAVFDSPDQFLEHHKADFKCPARKLKSRRATVPA